VGPGGLGVFGRAGGAVEEPDGVFGAWVAGFEDVARDGQVAFGLGVEGEGWLEGLGDVDVVWGLGAVGGGRRGGCEGASAIVGWDG